MHDVVKTDSKIKKMENCMVVIVIVLCLVSGLAAAEMETIRQSTKQDGSVSILVLGDWGRKGSYNQSIVANQMGIVAENLEADFVISTGDNFYDNGLEDVNDSAFDESFTSIYTAPSLQTQWYTVLGNHDYRGDVLAQLSPSLTERDARWFCRRSYTINSEMADIFMVDTTPFIDKYFDDREEHRYDWRDILPRTKYVSNLIKDLDLGLKKSSAKWKIVVGHHTIKSGGHHGNTQELITQLLPLLQDNYVDLYINGHDHCLQHISSPHSSLQFLTSGGGSKAWKGEISWWNPKEMKFYYDGQGFMSLEITQTQLTVIFYDIFGNLLHHWTTSKTLYSIL